MPSAACSSMCCERSRTNHTAITVNEMLQSTRRRVMSLFDMLDQSECFTKLRVKFAGSIAHHRQTAALGRSILGKGGNNNMPRA